MANNAPTFAVGDGIVTTNLGPGDAAYDLLVQPDGKIVLVGRGGNPTQFVLARHSPDGWLDASFGEAGTKVFPLGATSTASGVAFQPDGKFVLAGSVVSSLTESFVSARFDSDGTLDPTLNTNGIALTPVGTGVSGDWQQRRWRPAADHAGTLRRRRITRRALRRRWHG